MPSGDVGALDARIVQIARRAVSGAWPESQIEFEIRELVNSHEALLAALREKEWQPIETAPAGRDVLVVVDNRAAVGGLRVVGEARQHEDGWYWAQESSGDYHASQIWPTHWRPMPEPPEDLVASAPTDRSGA